MFEKMRLVQNIEAIIPLLIPVLPANENVRMIIAQHEKLERNL